MSTHNLPVNIDLEALRRALREASFAPSGVVYGADTSTPTALEFTPDLTAEQTTALAALYQRIEAARDDYAALDTYRNDLAAFLALASPTNAQTLAAVKTIIRVLRVLLDYLRR